jgi:tetratricopeptide (TPR) repeat protein
MASQFLASALLASLIFLPPANLFSQSTTPPISPPKDPWGEPNTGMIDSSASAGATLQLTIYNSLPRVLLDRQAMVKLSNQANKTVLWQATQGKSTTDFSDLPIGTYDVEVTAPGYLQVHQTLQVRRELSAYHLDIELKKDPVSIEVTDQSEAGIPSNARKEINRAVASLKSGDLKQAEEQLGKAYKIVPSSSNVNFLLGYLAFQKSQWGEAEDHLQKSVQLDPHNVQALTLLGRVYTQQKNYPTAETAFRQAVAANPRDWLAHNLLADTCLHLGKYQDAREQAQQALDEARGLDYSGEIFLGEALANLGQRDEAIAAFTRFLDKTPNSPTAPQVRDLIAQLQSPVAAASNDPVPQSTTKSRDVIDQILATNDFALKANAWGPPGIDEAKPPVAGGLACPSQEVIDGAGQRVKELVDDASRYVAIEQLVQEDLDSGGSPLTKLTRSYNYTASISESRPGYLAVDEYRSGYADGTGEFLGGISARGLPTLALVFHPAMRVNFELTCEGLGQWQGRAAWLVYFRQRADRPNRIQQYKIGDKVYPVDLRGRAWVLSDSFQIARIESELIRPVKDIQLLRQQQIVDYGPVPFRNKNVELWLPKNAELYFDFRRHHYYRRHSFDHFMLFSVDSEEGALRPK